MPKGKPIYEKMPKMGMKQPKAMPKKMPMQPQDHAEENMMERKKMMGMMPNMPPKGMPMMDAKGPKASIMPVGKPKKYVPKKKR